MNGRPDPAGDRGFQDRLLSRQIQHDIEEGKRRRLHDWLVGATRILVLANAGGAVATLTFIGTALAQGKLYRWAVPSLAVFFVGVVLAGIVILGQLRKAWFEELSPERPPERQDWFGKFVDGFLEALSGSHSPLLVGSLLLFCLGGILGVIVLLF